MMNLLLVVGIIGWVGAELYLICKQPADVSLKPVWLERHPWLALCVLISAATFLFMPAMLPFLAAFFVILWAIVRLAKGILEGYYRSGKTDA
jgi:membrane glycosyltransferase